MKKIIFTQLILHRHNGIAPKCVQGDLGDQVLCVLDVQNSDDILTGLETGNMKGKAR